MTMRILVSRTTTLPDPIKLARFLRAPELGPKVLFFTGGTALKALSRRIIDYTHNSIHLITPFDSGGSSAKLRAAFDMPAVGDLRNRLMALADRTVKGAPETYELFACRLPRDAAPQALRERLEAMLRGDDELVARVPDPMRKIIRTHLRFFVERMPEGFDLRGASIGNLILTGGYFNYDRNIDPVIYLFSKLVEARGQVRPVVNNPLHLVAELEDGSVLMGQHLLTGKETLPISVPVKRVYLTEHADDPLPTEVAIPDKTASLIAGADLICYPMGSFYTSLIANLLPRGVGESVAANRCPKVYIPNLGTDPEQRGMTLPDQVRTLLDYLERGCAKPPSQESLLNFLLVDTRHGSYGPASDLDKLKSHGLTVIDAPLVTDRSAPYLDEERVLEYLLSLV
ncbi:MAG: GAK system CofD-like protein [Desulfocurvibacter africanus]